MQVRTNFAEFTLPLRPDEPTGISLAKAGHTLGQSLRDCLATVWSRLAAALAAAILAVSGIPVSTPAWALETWEQLDKKFKSQVYQLNVGLKLRIKGDLYAYLADLSPKYHFPVYSTTGDDKGFRVVGFGTSFPVRTRRADRCYFLTNRHVADSADQIVKECQRFYAAMRLYAEQTATAADTEKRYRELLAIVNLSTKKDWSTSERSVYQSTVDGIWDTYETYLSAKADPSRILFQKYLAQADVQPDVSYFLHAPGPVSQSPLQAQLYKMAKAAGDPDIAILTVGSAGLVPMELDSEPPAEGQEIQVIGYPTASEQIDLDSAKYYAPTFNTGRISRVAPRILQVDAPVTTGNSGGPVVNQRGKVVGVVAVRALSARGGELPNFGGAVTVQSVQTFAPELFDELSSR